MSPSDRRKLVVAVAILVVAALVMAWQFGLFGGGGSRASVPRPAEAAPPPNQPRVAPPGGG